MRSRTYNLAVCGVFGSIQLVSLILAYYVDFLSLTLNAVAAIAMAVPLTKKFYRESIIAYIAVSLLAFLTVGAVGSLPYILFGGSYTLFTVFMHNSNVKYLFTVPIKIAWVNLAFFLLYSVFKVLVVDPEKVMPYLVYAIIISVAIIPLDIIALKFYDIIKAKSHIIFKE